MLHRLDRVSTFLVAVAAAPMLGCLEQPLRIDVVEPTGALIFDSPKDAIDVRVRVLGDDMTEIPHPKIRWSTSNPHIAVVSKDGRVTPKRDGRVTITARAGYVEKDLPVVVRFYAALQASPAELSIAPGEKADLTAEIFDARGERMIGNVTFKSRDPAIATVDAEGHVTAQSFGATIIDVAAKHLSATVFINVSPMNAS